MKVLFSLSCIVNNSEKVVRLVRNKVPRTTVAQTHLSLHGLGHFSSVDYHSFIRLPKESAE
jgi:hypothetical protein